MKTIKQLREEYDNLMVHNAPDELMLEGRDSSVMKSSPKGPPVPSDMPAMLMFRRVAYRQYPGKQYVALYYSKLVNKYLSIPFGPDGNLNLSEAVIHDQLEEGMLKTAAKTVGGALGGGLAGANLGSVAAPVGTVVGGLIGAGLGARKAYKKAKEQEKKEKMEEDWQKINRHDGAGLSQKAVNAYRREHPGSKLKTAVTTEPSKLKKGSKSANRRKSFCARMGGMKKRLTSAKTARDPDSRINKALRKWNCEESFKQKLYEKRQERLDEFAPAIAAAELAAPVIGTVARGAISAGARGAIGSGIKNVVKSGIRAGSKILRRIGVASLAAKKAEKEKGSKDTESDPAISKYVPNYRSMKTGVSGTSSTKMARDTAPQLSSTQQSKYNANVLKPVKENKISDIQNMINEGVDNMDLTINGRSITLNNSMAKKIIRVYESVNTKNKKIVESMLNEDLDSFKKLLNFSIKA